MSNRLGSTSDKITLYPFLGYDSTSGIGPRQESEDYLLDMKVRIQAEYDIDDDPTQTGLIDLGELRFTLIRMGSALNEGFHFHTLFDSSQSLSDLGGALYEPDFSEFVEPIRDRFSSAEPFEDLLYLRSLTVAPFARGQRLGISALHRVINDWESGCALVALQAKPLQFERGIRAESRWEKLALASLSQDGEIATAKLENHYRGLGFDSLDDIPYMLMCPKQRQMPVDEQALVHSIDLSLEELEQAL
ncbi:MAG: hypothetical protein L3J39_02650 [Verrucomicrobiales bacterium]|nr:hypothetical protein [Verrucomicrobiales bacterium]